MSGPNALFARDQSGVACNGCAAQCARIDRTVDNTDPDTSPQITARTCRIADQLRCESARALGEAVNHMRVDPRRRSGLVQNALRSCLSQSRRQLE